MPSPPPAAGRVGRAGLVFARTAERTFLARQHVGYPFHVTRPFHFDAEPAHLATLYLQSSSGGLYRGDRLSIAIEAGADTAVHITSQASTVVHHARGDGVVQEVVLDAGPGAFLAFATDPLILFPGAAIETRLTVRLAAGATALVTDAFLTHDPEGSGRPFDLYRSSVEVLDAAGRRLMVDRARLRGEDLGGGIAPQGGFAASASVYALGLAGEALAPERLEQAVAGDGILAGASPLPNGAGLGMRILAGGGVPLSRALDAAFAAVFTARFGAAPGRRRK